jgi:hypothetical protein
MSDTIVAPESASLGANIDGPPPPPSAAPATPTYEMAMGEPFTREEYHAAGWTDEQLIAVGKMRVVDPAKIELEKPIGMPDRVWIVLDDNDDIPPTGLFIGHNGTGFLLATGIPIPVPDYLLGILDDAIMDAPILDPQTKQVKGYRPRPRYTYRRVPAPAEA